MIHLHLLGMSALKVTALSNIMMMKIVPAAARYTKYSKCDVCHILSDDKKTT